MTVLGVVADPVETDELLKIVNSIPATAKKKEKEELFKILFSYLSCLAALDISNATMNQVDLMEQYGINATGALQSAVLKEVIQKTVFRSTGETWPVGFTEFVTTLFSKNPTPKWCTDNGIQLYSPERKRLVFFGCKVKASADLAKKLINKLKKSVRRSNN